MIFINNNNQPHLQNDGQINAATVQTITRADPQNTKDFKKIFNDIHSKLIPKCRRGTRKFKPYPYTAADFITTAPSEPTTRSDDQNARSSSKSTARSHIRKRKSYQNRDRNGKSPHKPK